MNYRLTIACVAALLSLSNASAARADIKSDMDALTGGQHTRVAWLNGGDRLHGGGKLMGYDSRTNQSTQILAAATRQNRPILCSGGHRVIVSIDYKVHVVDWDGTNKRYLVDGICSDAWVDPATGKEWFVARTGGRSTSGDLYRYLLEDPTQKKLLYDAKNVGIDYFQWYQISPDGKMAVDFLPWSKCYVIDDGGLTTNGIAHQVSDGCWSSVAKDNGRYWYHLTCCPHKTLKVFKYKTFVAEVAINAGPRPSGTKSDEFYHPKSAGKGAPFLTVTGGYYGNSGSDDAEVYFGKWNGDYRSFAGWVRMTSNGNADYTPDAWVGVEAQEPSINLSADTLRFQAEQGGSAPSPQTLAVTSHAGTLQNLRVQSGQSWLTVSLSGFGGSYTVTNTVDPSGLAADVHVATVTVSADNTNPSLRKYTVVLSVRGAPKATAIDLAPSSATVLLGATKAFSATVKDQYGDPLSPQPALAWSVEGSCGTIDAGTFTAGTTAGSCQVVAAVSGLTSRAAVEVVKVQPVHIKVNCGDNSPSVSGWEPDTAYLVAGQEGTPYDFGGTHDLSGAAQPAPHDVYQTVRHTNHAYSFADLPNGTYTVRLHFTDGYAGGDGRAMDYTIEGQKVIDNLSIQQATGGVNKVLVKELTVSVNDGNGMQIVCDKDQGNDVFEAGIEVIGGAAAPPLVLTSALAGKTFAVGDKLTIAWKATGAIIGVVIEVSPNGGRDYYPILSTNAVMPQDPAWTDGYTWTVPEAITDSDGNPVSVLSNQVVIKIYNYGGEEYGVSGTFAIGGAGSVQSRAAGPAAAHPAIRLTTSRGISVSAAAGTVASLYSPRGTLLRRATIGASRRLNWSLAGMPAACYLVAVECSAGRHSRHVVIAR